MNNSEKCIWRLDDYEWNAWESECDYLFTLTDGTPLENKMVYCPRCGKKIVTIKQKENAE